MVLCGSGAGRFLEVTRSEPSGRNQKGCDPSGSWETSEPASSSLLNQDLSPTSLPHKDAHGRPRLPSGRGPLPWAHKGLSVPSHFLSGTAAPPPPKGAPPSRQGWAGLVRQSSRPQVVFISGSKNATLCSRTGTPELVATATRMAPGVQRKVSPCSQHPHVSGHNDDV